MKDQEPCVRCGKPSHDHHHARHDNLNMGKGMGGADDSHFLLLDLCRGCHDRAHAKLTLFTEEKGKITWTDVDGATGTRSLKLTFDEQDEWLATQWGEADKLGKKAIIVQAEVANKFRRKYGGFDHWWVRVADIIREVTGLQISVGTVYDRAGVGMALEVWQGDPDVFLEDFGVKAGAALGRAVESVDVGRAEGVIAFAIGELEGGATRTSVATAIKKEFLGLPTPLHLKHVCSCGEVWEIW